MDSREGLKERLRQRRRAMQNTQASQMTMEPTDTSNGTWTAAMEMTDRPAASGIQMMEDVERAPEMMKDLEARRLETKKELNKSLRTKTIDVSAEIRSARHKSRKKVQEDVDDGVIEEETTLTLPVASPDDAEVKSHTGVLESSQPNLSTSMRREGLASLKEKLRQKLAREQSEKQAVAESQHLNESQPQRRLKGMRDRPVTVTRFDESQPGTELDDQLNKSTELRKKWKKAIDETKKESFLPSREEQYDFFTNTYDDTAEEDEMRMSTLKAGLMDASRRTVSVKRTSADKTGASTSHEADQEGEPAEENEEDEDMAVLIPPTVVDGVRSEHGYVVVASEYVPNQVKLNQEKLVYFVPSSVQVPLNEKIQEGCEPRDLSEEGYFVGQKPLVTIKARNRMEHRLLKENNRRGLDWFGEDGYIISLPDPVKQTPSRPIISDELDPILQTYYRKAITREFDSRYIDGGSEGVGQYRLDVDINSLSFNHHDLMSREHVLASRLQSLVNQYIQRQKQRVTDYYLERIQVLRSAIVHLEDSKENRKNADDAESGTGDVYLDSLEKRRTDYIRELRDMRKLCDNEEFSDRELLKHLTKTWTSLKSLRTYQNCVNTPIKLTFEKIIKDKKEDMAQLKEDMADELSDLKREHALDYQLLYDIYKEQQNKYKQQQKNKREAERRLKRSARHREEGNEDLLNVEQEIGDQATVDKLDLLKPSPPDKFDEKTERSRIEEKYKRNKRRPGEPVLKPDVGYDANVTSQHHAAPGEQQRREAVHSCRLYAQIYYNNKPVAKTDIRRLNQDFTVSFAQIIPIRIIQWPDSLHIEIYEVGAILDRLLATVYAAIPATTVTSESVVLDNVEFANQQTSSHNHEGVGAGVEFTIDIQGAAPETITQMTNGILKCSVAWGVDSEGNPLVPVNSTNLHQSSAKTMDAVREIGASAMMDMDKLARWLSDSRIDPNDPSNAELVYLLRPKGGGETIRGPQYFRLEQLQEDFNFVTDEEINDDSRFKLLELRERGIPEFRNLKMVPSFSNDIPGETFKSYNKRLEEEARVNEMEGSSHRAVVTRFMQRIRQQVLERKRMAAHQKTLQELITEEPVPNISAIVLNIGQKLERRHPLRPTRKSRKPLGSQNLQDGDVKVMINITRAHDIPCRREETGPRVRPFFELMFQRERRITTVAEGPNPSWNEEINLPFRSPNSDYTATSLQTVTDNIYINLFDEYLVDVLTDDRQRDRVLHKRIEKKWLGGITIPFSTLYANGMISGTFKLDSPAILLGYKQEMSSGSVVNTYVSLYMTIEPSLGVAPEITEHFESNEAEELLDAAEKYMSTFADKFPERPITTAVTDINGKTVFVTKYFKALEPPQEVLNLAGDKDKNVARFVSTIPFISDSVTYPGMCDIWTTCDQFLQMLSGDEEEHAVLLTNYFLHMGRDAYLCIGVAIPEGVTAYCVVREGTQTYIWNAMKGERYNATETYCPLVKVGCLINQDNIWGNIQKTEDPKRLIWDISNNKAWQPFFTNKFANPGITSVQPERLLYFDTDREYVLDLQQKLEHGLKEKFEKEWRRRDVTRWNRQNVQIFRSLLVKLEQTGGQQLSQQHTEELKNINTHYKLSGFTLNMPYTDLEPIADAVYATGVWECDSPGVEFALAVHIHPYPSTVLSVWVYVASLQRLRY